MTNERKCTEMHAMKMSSSDSFVDIPHFAILVASSVVSLREREYLHARNFTSRFTERIIGRAHQETESDFRANCRGSIKILAHIREHISRFHWIIPRKRSSWTNWRMNERRGVTNDLNTRCLSRKGENHRKQFSFKTWKERC